MDLRKTTRIGLALTSGIAAALLAVTPLLGDEIITASVMADTFNTDATPPTDMDSDSTTSGSVSANASSSSGFPSSSSSNAAAFASTGGILRASSSVNSGEIPSVSASVSPVVPALDLSASSSASWQNTVTNNTGAAQSYSLGFFVDNISLSVGGGGDTFIQALNGYDDYLTATLAAEVSVNSQPIYGFWATLTADDWGNESGFTSGAFGPDGVPVPDFMGTPGSGFRFAPAFSGNLPLGVFGPGQSFTVEYLADTGTASQGIPVFGIFANARFGDPLDMGGGGAMVELNSQPAVIPEPPSYAVWLLAAMAAVVCGWRLSKRKQATSIT